MNKMKDKSTLALVFSIIGLFVFPFSIAGLIIGTQVKKENPEDSTAKAAVIISIIAIVLNVFFAVSCIACTGCTACLGAASDMSY